MSNIVPLPGIVICKPYIQDSTFQSDKEEPGESQKSVVFQVGGSITDDHGNFRECPVEIGDVIVHRYAIETFEFNHEPYRIVPFYQIFTKLV